jgi:hypothetical protein
MQTTSQTKTLSIHPYVKWFGNGRRQIPAPNSCGRKSTTKLQRALAGLEKHAAEHPRDAVTALRITNIKRRIAA